MKSFKVMLVPNNRQRTRLFQFAGTARFSYSRTLINRKSTVRKLNKKQRRLQRYISRKYEMNNKKGESYSKTRNIIKSEKKLLRIHHRLADIRRNYRHRMILSEFKDLHCLRTREEKSAPVGMNLSL